MQAQGSSSQSDESTFLVGIHLTTGEQVRRVNNRKCAKKKSTWNSGLLMSMGVMTVKAFLTFILKVHGLLSSALSQYLMLPCLPSKDVQTPLKENKFQCSCTEHHAI